MKSIVSIISLILLMATSTVEAQAFNNIFNNEAEMSMDDKRIVPLTLLPMEIRQDIDSRFNAYDFVDAYQISDDEYEVTIDKDQIGKSVLRYNSRGELLEELPLMK